MENQKISPWKANFNWGLILGFTLILYSALLYFTNQSLNKNLGYISLVIYILFIYMGIKSYRNNYLNGFISYGQAVSSGVLISLYSAVLTAAFTYILYSVIDPGLIQKMLDMSEQQMLDKGLSDEQVKMALKVTGKFMKPLFMTISALFSGVFFGLIVSLIEAIFLKKEGSPVKIMEEAQAE